MVPSPEHPLTGRCACGGVRFAITAPFHSARYCHCHRCQRRSGAGFSANARIAGEHLELLAGEELLRAWRPESGLPKWFCVACGGHLWSRPDSGELLFVRLGSLDDDPGIRPQHRQWVASAVSWEEIPDDGLPRFAESTGVDGPPP